MKLTSSLMVIIVMELLSYGAGKSTFLKILSGEIDANMHS